MQKLDTSHDWDKPGLSSIRPVLAPVGLLAAILLFASACLHTQAPPVRFTIQEVSLDGLG
jgi:hypothetical protein